ncbi:fused 4'-phosphopantothenoylcysteine decarboxylase and phosphopantothenoylcysteine synthetase [Gammaproteobacteria bacterium]
MSPLSDKKILLGVSGGIAAYKTPELVRRLRDAGATVRVVMTHAATAFITPLTLQATSANPVHTELLDPAAEAGMGHIELSRWADVILIAPATADLMARLTAGLADDLLTTLCLASPALLCLAPAMNHVMWAAPATTTNRDILLSRGVRLFGPAEGKQACGEIGTGRMEEPNDLVRALEVLFSTPPLLAGRRVLVTAGPTREAIDPVRFLSNRSSGKMGYAIAAAAVAMGAQVTLVTGPTALPTPGAVTRIDVVSAQEMRDAVLNRMDTCEIFIACAAVADYRPIAAAPQKIKKKGESPLTLVLERTDDILAMVGNLPHRPFTVGFAAETENLETNAQDKLHRKGVDMIAANWVGGATGFESDDNALQVYWIGGQGDLPRARKSVLARSLLEIIVERLSSKDAPKPISAIDPLAPMNVHDS